MSVASNFTISGILDEPPVNSPTIVSRRGRDRSSTQSLELKSASPGYQHHHEGAEPGRPHPPLHEQTSDTLAHGCTGHG